MANVTITLEERVLGWIRVAAARRGTSVSRLVGELLAEQMAREEGYQDAMRRFLAREPVALKTVGRYPARDELHDRAGLR